MMLRIRNEDKYLDEWFQYYLAMGFHNFLVYEDPNPDLPPDKTGQVLDFWKRLIPGMQILKVDPSDKTPSNVYALKRTEFRYILYADIDEFLVVRHGVDLEKKLELLWSDDVACAKFHRYNVVNKEDYNKATRKGPEVLKPTRVMCNTVEAWKDTQRNHKCFASPSRSEPQDGHESKPHKPFKLVSLPVQDIYMIHTFLRTKDEDHRTSRKHGRTDKHIVNSYRLDDKRGVRARRANMHKRAVPHKAIGHSQENASALFQNFYDKYGFLIVRNDYEDAEMQTALSKFDTRRCLLPSPEWNGFVGGHLLAHVKAIGRSDYVYVNREIIGVSME